MIGFFRGQRSSVRAAMKRKPRSACDEHVQVELD